MRRRPASSSPFSFHHFQRKKNLVIGFAFIILALCILAMSVIFLAVEMDRKAQQEHERQHTHVNPYSYKRLKLRRERAQFCGANNHNIKKSDNDDDSSVVLGNSSSSSGRGSKKSSAATVGAGVVVVCCEQFRLVANCTCPPDGRDGSLCGVVVGSRSSSGDNNNNNNNNNNDKNLLLGSSRCAAGRCLTQMFRPFPRVVDLRLDDDDDSHSTNNNNHNNYDDDDARKTLWPRSSKIVSSSSYGRRVTSDLYPQSTWEMPTIPITSSSSSSFSSSSPPPPPPRPRFSINCVVESYMGLSNIQLSLAACLALGWQLGVAPAPPAAASTGERHHLSFDDEIIIQLPTYLDHHSGNFQLLSDVFDLNYLKSMAQRHGLNLVESDPQHKYRATSTAALELSPHHHHHSFARSSKKMKRQQHKIPKEFRRLWLMRDSTTEGGEDNNAGDGRFEFRHSKSFCIVCVPRILWRACKPLAAHTAVSWAERLMTRRSRNPSSSNDDDDDDGEKSNPMGLGCASQLRKELDDFFSFFHHNYNNSNNSTISVNTHDLRNQLWLTNDDLDFDFPDVRIEDDKDAVKWSAEDWSHCINPSSANHKKSSSSGETPHTKKNSDGGAGGNGLLQLRLNGIFFSSFAEFREGSFLKTLDWFRPSEQVLSIARRSAIHRLQNNNVMITTRGNNNNNNNNDTTTTTTTRRRYIGVHFRHESDIGAWRLRRDDRVLELVEKLAIDIGISVIFVAGKPFQNTLYHRDESKRGTKVVERQLDDGTTRKLEYFTGETFFNKNIVSYNNSMLDRIVVEEADVAVVWDPFVGVSSFSQAIYDARCRRRKKRRKGRNDDDHDQRRQKMTFSYSLGTGQKSTRLVLEC